MAEATRHGHDASHSPFSLLVHLMALSSFWGVLYDEQSKKTSEP